MPSYRNCACAICFQPLNRPQNTCGGGDCLNTWKHLSSAARLRQKNLASCPPSERALILARGPSQDELDQQAAIREQLAEAIEEQQTNNQRQMDDARGHMPKSLRAVFLDNAPIKPEGGDSTEENELPRTSPETPSGG